MGQFTRRTALRLTFAGSAFPLTAAHAAAAGEPTLHVVTISNTAFTPTHITIRAGDTIRWINEDEGQHSAWDLFDNFDTGLLATGKSAAFTFHTPRTFTYRCRVDERLRGTITVTR